MKRAITIFMILAFFAAGLIITAPVSTPAQSIWYQKYRDSRGRIRYRRVAKPSVYRRHRNVINMGIGTGAGAIIGGLIGGKKGALIGAGAGAGGSALYTYKLKKKKRRYVRARSY